MTRGRKVLNADLQGVVFGRLTVQALLPKVGALHRCLCLCQCGTEVEVSLPSLQQGKTASCGCLRSEGLRARRLLHGVTTAAGTEDQKRAFNCWVSLRARCQNPENSRYPVYGG